MIRIAKNKGADQLRSSLFSHMQKAVFSQRGSFFGGGGGGGEREP